MQFILTLANDQSKALYDYLQNIKMDRAKNKNRWKFLEVIEDKVFNYEREITKLNNEVNDSRNELITLQSDENISSKVKLEKQKAYAFLDNKNGEELKKLAKVSHQFIFKDRESFVEMKDLFEKYTGDSEKPEEVTGQQSKLLYQVGEAFIERKEIEDKKAK